MTNAIDRNDKSLILNCAGLDQCLPLFNPRRRPFSYDIDYIGTLFGYRPKPFWKPQIIADETGTLDAF